MEKINITCCVLLAVPQLSVGQNLIKDGGFENTSGSSWLFDLGSEWSGGSEAIAWDPQPSGIHGGRLETSDGLVGISAAREGDFLAFVSDPVVETFQIVATTVGTTYNISGLLGNGENASRVQSGANGGAIAGAFINDVAVFEIEEGEWANFSETFVATSDLTKISIGFVQPDANSSSIFLVADNFSLVAVPEPSSVILSALGFFGLLMQRRRS